MATINTGGKMKTETGKCEQCERDSGKVHVPGLGRGWRPETQAANPHTGSPVRAQGRKEKVDKERKKPCVIRAVM